MIKLILIILAFLLPFASGGQMLAPDQMRRDLEVFREALEVKHPEAFRYISREKFAELIEKTGKSFTAPLTRKDFYVRMTPLIVALRCGHTKWLVPGKDMYYPFDETDLFPLPLFFTGDRAYVTGSFEGSHIPAYSELLSVNGEPVGSIKEMLFNYLSFADGYSTGGKYYQLNNFFPGIFATFCGTVPEYEVELRDKDGIRMQKLSGVTLDQITRYNESVSQDDTVPFEFEVLENNTALIDIDRFFAFPGEMNYNKFLKESFRQVREQGISNLIIDLRGNEGGNENWGIELYSYLAGSPFRYYDHISVCKKQDSEIDFKIPVLFRIAGLFNRKGNGTNEFTLGRGLKEQKPARDTYSGRAYLLLDGQSFSVATEFASRVKSDGRCTVVGSETAGGYALNTSGFFTIVNLPNSEMDLGIPLMGFHMAGVGDMNPKDRGVLPDHYVYPTIDQLKNNTDFIKEYTLNLIRSSGQDDN